MIYDYCERHGPGLFAEPVNTLTNLAGRYRIRTWDVNLLIGLAATVGVGSGIWHMFATPWARPLDRIPILLFQLCFLWMYLRSCAGRSAGTATIRSIDSLACGHVPFGTHFLWHLFSGGLFYVAMRTLILQRARGMGVSTHMERSVQ